MAGILVTGHYLCRIITEPLLSGGLLLLLTKTPPGIRSNILQIPQGLSSKRLSMVTVTLQVLLAVGLLARLNQALNWWARGHWCLRLQGQAWDFSGEKETAVVTGGSSGFGLLMARKLSRTCRVAVVDVQTPPEDLLDNPKIKFYQCDLTARPAIHQAASKIRSDLGHPSILINNAGIARPQSLLSEDEDHLERIFKVNCISHFVLIKEFLPAMLEDRKGHIVTMASVGSFMSGAPLVDYCATKAAAVSLHEGLVSELQYVYQPNGRCIQATVVHPAAHATGMLPEIKDKVAKAGGSLYRADNVANAVVDQILSGRGGQLVVPDSWRLVCVVRGAPAWVQALLRDAGLGRQ